VGRRLVDVVFIDGDRTVRGFEEELFALVTVCVLAGLAEETEEKGAEA